MSEALAKFAKARKRAEKRPRLPPDERKALAKIRSEAKAAGATLETAGEGGLPPSRVLGVFRRDEWRCHRCGKQERLSIHHKAGATNLVSKALAKRGHRSKPEDLVTICGECHDAIHNEDRAAGGENGG